MDPDQTIIDSLTTSISALEDYKDNLENHSGQVISVKIKQMNDILKTNVSQGMADHINERKEFFQGGGVQDWISSEIIRTTEKLVKFNGMLANLQG